MKHIKKFERKNKEKIERIEDVTEMSSITINDLINELKKYDLSDNIYKILDRNDDNGMIVINTISMEEFKEKFFNIFFIK